jgi:predicted DNA-binding transcriptional regulator AlpA
MFLTDRQVGERYNVTRTTVWRWRKVDPTFPKPVMLSPGCVRFRLADLEAWELTKAASAA